MALTRSPYFLNYEFSIRLPAITQFKNGRIQKRGAGSRSMWRRPIKTSEQTSTAFPGSLFSASLSPWNRDSGSGWSPDHPESGWWKNLLEGWCNRVFYCHSDKFTKAGRERYVAWLSSFRAKVMFQNQTPKKFSFLRMVFYRPLDQM